MTDAKERSNIEVDLSFVSVNDPSGMSGRDSTTTTPASARRCPSYGGNNPKFRADASGLRVGLAASDAEWATESLPRATLAAASVAAPVAASEPVPTLVTETHAMRGAARPGRSPGGVFPGA
ncbi:hypothetical protein J2S43_008246 [Catenuloplanes nepalensis]|uniref:Uncharacterized protein n=1 Tax=Catenuloplanes nepalensis TaxID=587533 RepID=A0ABT9N7P9_9ACTN|nr:hypothetical protein [Catenuloplanes nepalensis]MDP9799734.1 hypothetical protein [Catenuloplanes nepalensis]